MQEAESIYSIIKPEYQPIQKERHYKSKYAYNIPPTASTFGNKTTSRPNIANLCGSLELIRGSHDHKGFKSKINYLRHFWNKKGRS